ncbi:MAG: ornithine carbamoyltransferase, partial [Acidobacteriota bacterium]
MPFNLRHRHFLTLLDFSPQEVRYLLDLSRDLKRAKYAGTEQPRLRGKNIALIFEKASTRTRCAFEVATFDQGGHVTYLGPAGSHLGYKESVKDTARVLGRMYDGIEYRGFAQKTVETLAEYSGVPVWNGLTDAYHPTQILADVMTMREHCPKPMSDMSLCYLGDGGNNMGNSLMIGAAKLGIDFRIAAPEGYRPEEALQARCREIAAGTGAEITVTGDVAQAVDGVD